MKEQILNEMADVLGALNNIYVKGRDNLGNLSGSIRVLEQIAAQIRAAAFVKDEKGGMEPEDAGGGRKSRAKANGKD